MRFENRLRAGEELAVALAEFQHAVVLGLPRGGVEVAAPVARALGAPLDVVLAHKVGWPGNPESAAGAVGESGGVWIHPVAAQRLTPEYLAAATTHELELLRDKGRWLRQELAPVPLEGRTAIIVDDGLATGQTMLAAVGETRQRGAARIVVAVPVGAREAVEMLAAECDQVVCLVTPRPLIAVGNHYVDFSQTSDATVLRLLRPQE